MARLPLNVDSITVQSFAVLPTGPVQRVTASQFPDCDSFSGGDVCCSDGCPDSHTCPGGASCNRQCTWPECPVALI
jgi:predicted nucleic acid binding AN1-type Zn finger protein